MQGLLSFLYKYRAFLVFILLEIVSGWMIVKNNAYQSSAFFHSSNYVSGRLLGFSNNVYEYLHLREENARLAEENAHLQYLYNQTIHDRQAPSDYRIDSLMATKYKFIPAKVINNSIRNVSNYMTIDKGLLDGIQPGMGVITANGVAGKIKTCSDHFSTVVSLLHLDMLVSAQLKKNNVVGSVKWEGKNPREVSLREIPRDIDVRDGDTVVTSQYNSVFPKGILIGRVKKTGLRPGETFHEIDVSLATDYYSLMYVYVIDNQLKPEKDKLENAGN